jgi:hypothetical protein
VEAVRNQAVRHVRLFGLAMGGAWLLAVLVGFGLFDYLLRTQDVWARGILSVCALAVIGWGIWRWLRPALAYRASLIDVARRIERVEPSLAHRLSAAVDFLAQPEQAATAGSADLRRAVIAETEAMSAGIDFRRAIDPRRLWRSVALLAGMLAIVAVLTAAQRNTAGLALQRLAMPWRSELAWPRRNDLAWAKNPTTMAVGDDFEVELVDRAGDLPERVEIQIRRETPSGTRLETLEMKPLDERMVFRLDNVREGFAYRARGGDDDAMPWTELTVLEPPKVTELEIVVTPPAYTGMPRSAAGRIVKAIHGSALAVRGAVDRPIVRAALRGEAAEQTLPEVQIVGDGRRFVVPASPQTVWPVQASGALWIEIEDESGLVTSRDTRFELQAVADQPPTIGWETPPDQAYVTARARLPVRVIVKDDLAVRLVELRYVRPGSSGDGERVVPLFVGPERAQPTGVMATGESHTIEYEWDLSQLAGLAAGDVLAVRVTAEDYLPQMATSLVRKLTIITDQELESRLAQRQTSVLNQLSETLRLERECRQQLIALEERLSAGEPLEESHINQLQSQQFNQRQVDKLLGPGPEGVEGQLTQLLAELTANQLEAGTTAARMRDLAAQVRRLNQEPLPAINQQLTETFKEWRAAADDGTPAENLALPLAEVGARQQEVIDALEGMLGSLTEWDSFSRLAREVGQLRSEQEKISTETETLRLAAIAAIGQPADQRAALRQLARRELDLARQFDKLQGRMEAMLARLTASDPVAASKLADALSAARRLAIGGRMRTAADELGRVRLSPAREAQTAALEGLAELLDVLSSRRDEDLARNTQALRGAAGDLAGMIAAQQALAEEIAAAEADPDAVNQKRRLERLARELAQLEQQIQDLSRRLQRLGAPRAAAAVGAAGQRAGAAAQQAAAGDADQARQENQQAGSRLEEAQREVAAAIAQAEQELAQQQLAQMQQWIEGLAQRQKNVVSETERLEQARQVAGGQLPDPEQATLRNLAGEQRAVAEETEHLRQKLSAAAAFEFALSAARKDMQSAADALGQGQTGPAAVRPAQSAAQRLTQMLEALAPDSGTPGPSSPSDSPPPPPAAEGGQKDPFTSLAELKLLELLQQEVNRRTTQVEVEAERQRGAGGELPAELLREMESLAAEQGRLAEMVLELIRESTVAPEDNPALGELEAPRRKAVNPGPQADGR